MIIHIWHQQVNKRRSVTTIEGFDADIDVRTICKVMKKRFACNGSVKDMVIILQGDQCHKARDFLHMIDITDDIIIHG